MKPALKLTFCFILSMLIVYSFGQDQIKVDSLLSLLPAESDSLTSTICLGLKNEYAYVDFEKSETYGLKAYEFANKSKVPDLINKTAASLGRLYADFGDEENSIKWYKTSIDGLNEKTQGPEIASVLNDWGIAYCAKGNYEKGMVKFQEALNIVNVKWPDAPIKGECLLSLGMIHGSLRNYEISDNYLKKAIDFFKKADNLPLWHETVLMLGINQYENYQFEDAEVNFLNVIDYFESSGDLFNASKTCSNLGGLYHSMDSLDKAEIYLKKGLKIAREIEREHLQLVMYQRLGEVTYSKGYYTESIEYFNQSIPMSISLNDIRAQAKDNYCIAEAYNQVGEYDLAYSHMFKYVKLQDSILSQDKIYQMNELEKKYESERKEQEIIILEERAKRDSLEKKGLIGGIAAILALLGSFIFAMRQRMKKNKLIREKTNQELAFRTREFDLKQKELTSKMLQLCRKNEFLKSLEKQVNELRSSLKGEEKTLANRLSRQINRDLETDLDWAQFLKSFESIHPDFNKKLKERHPGLSANEIRMIYLLKMNLGTKEIASLFNITADGVKKSRHRMRKKLGLDSSVDLPEYFINFENKPVVNI